MDAAVLVESMFGNTRLIAEAIADELTKAPGISVRAPDAGAVIDAGAVSESATAGMDFVAGAELLVVGGPTHMHGASRPASRKAAVEQGAHPEAAALGVHEIVGELPDGAGKLAACFDTRLPKAPWLTGSASKVLARELKRRGYRVLLPCGSFIVTDSEGPLADGELERARAWARDLLPNLQEPRSSHV